MWHKLCGNYLDWIKCTEILVSSFWSRWSRKNMWLLLLSVDRETYTKTYKEWKQLRLKLLCWVPKVGRQACCFLFSYRWLITFEMENHISMSFCGTKHNMFFDVCQNNTFSHYMNVYMHTDCHRTYDTYNFIPQVWANQVSYWITYQNRVQRK